MLINASVLNGAKLNGSSLRTSYGSAGIIAGATVSSVALIVVSAAAVVQVSGAIVLAGLYGLSVAEAPVIGQSQLHIQTSAYISKAANADIDGIASIPLDIEQIHDSGSVISGTAEVIPFQGDAAAILGSATVDPNATLGMDTEAKADGGNATVIASVILHAGGVDTVTGSANVDAVPSMIYAGDTFTTHDGHTRLAGSGLLEPPDDPLHKILSIENGGFVASAFSSANSTIAHAGFSSSLCSASVISSPVLDLFYQASILFPSADVQAQAHVLRSNDEPIVIDGVSVNYFTGHGVMLPLIGIDGNAYTTADATRVISANACCMLSNATILADGDIIAISSANINGSCTVLADLSSNPYAHAPERRVLTMTEDSREVIIRSDDRTITMSPT